MLTTHSHPRNSRRAVHLLVGLVVSCGATYRQVQTRSAGASTRHDDVTCEACLAAMPYVTQAAERWYRGTSRREPRSAIWYRAMSTRLHIAAQRADVTRRQQLERLASLARQCAGMAVAS